MLFTSITFDLHGQCEDGCSVHVLPDYVSAGWGYDKILFQCLCSFVFLRTVAGTLIRGPLALPETNEDKEVPVYSQTVHVTTNCELVV